MYTRAIAKDLSLELGSRITVYQGAIGITYILAEDSITILVALYQPLFRM
jgi:hypothetical protein